MYILALVTFDTNHEGCCTFLHSLIAGLTYAISAYSAELRGGAALPQHCSYWLAVFATATPCIYREPDL